MQNLFLYTGHSDNQHEAHIQSNLMHSGDAKPILCSVLNWQSPSHYIFIRQQNNLFDRAHLLLQACITHILRACKMCAQSRDAHLLWHAQDYFRAWINLSLIISANLVLNKVYQISCDANLSICNTFDKLLIFTLLYFHDSETHKRLLPTSPEEI